MEFMKKNSRNLSLIITIIFLIIIFSSLSTPFLSLESFMNLIRSIAPIAILSIGMTLVILTGNIDISIGSALALCGASAALIIKLSGNGYLGFIFSITVGCAVGFINGFLVGKLKINSVIVTLGMYSLTRGLTLVLTNSETIRVESGVFNWLGGYNFKIFSSNAPISGFLIIILYIFFYILQKKSVFMRRIRSIGANPNSSKVVGIAVEKNIIIVYLLMGLLVGISAILSVGRISSIAPHTGIGLEFEAITIVLIGGASLFGGEANIENTFMGLLLLGILVHGLKLINVNIYYIDLTKGLVLLFAVWFNLVSKKYQIKYS